MRKLFLLTIIALFTFFNVNAQSKMSFGLRAIPTFNWVSVYETIDSLQFKNNGLKMGIGFGPSLRYKLSDNFNVDVSGIFTWQKFGIDVTNSNTFTPIVNINETYKMQFVQIPLNLNGQFDVSDDFQALINFGIGTGVLLKSSRLVTNSSSYDPGIKMLTFIDFYLTAGAGVVYNIEDNLHLSLTVQYNNGIIDGWIDSKNTVYNESVEIETPLEIKHKNVALSIGFYIDI